MYKEVGPEAKQFSPAVARNRDPIAAAIGPRLADARLALEIASGTGEHAIHFASIWPHLRWQPSDYDDIRLRSVRAWREDAGLSNLLDPVQIDVLESAWPVESGAYDAAFCANMIHIAPAETVPGLFRGLSQALRAGAEMFLYGPFRIGGAHTAPSNAAFDENLRGRNPHWGIRDLEAVVEVAGQHGMDHVDTVAMPANNQIVIFRR